MMAMDGKTMVTRLDQTRVTVGHQIWGLARCESTTESHVSTMTRTPHLATACCAPLASIYLL